ncbi:T9SS type A sorting domain-containing protein [Neolewinella aurantiaca]|uniref:T9SS type A sorting domain-containing protein n=1 Tax=Neolewinella aurantiaca TaxID=2602767 RepID=A0A5C7F7G7_9BACT|nr:T9SS type A sorting domain-containing protein [Neolewinella aurantiaca]TXF85953.1 T9SS type A sorting domain-containing protein [Neolewinella aurantiaca]
MLTRTLLVIFTLLFSSVYLAACSCENIHTPLEEMICRADTTGGLVLELEMTIRIGNNQEARFNIEEVHVGSTDLREINLTALTSCAWYMGEEDRPGKRYLYFTNNDWLDGNNGELFTCALSSNIYRMNHRGTTVEYPVEMNGRNDHLAYRNFSSALAGCSSDVAENRLKNLYLTNNPGPGLLQIFNRGNPLPSISSIDVYNAAGQLMQHSIPGHSERSVPIELRSVPAGVYLIVVRDGRFLKSLRYVKR